MFDTSFAYERINHSTKSPQACQLVMIKGIDNLINGNQMSLT